MSSNSTPSMNHRKIISGALTRTELKTQLYCYDKLEGSNDIRLIVLPPGSFYSSVRCDIIHVDLAEAPDYEALSYTWADCDGDKSLTGNISCGPDGQQIPITRNCEAALRHLRLERETRFLWIDAICINQTTLEERNHQVSIMSKIYRMASRVVVYLGEATRDRDEFIYFLNNKIDAQLSSPPIQQAISVLRCGWFTRLWVFQEITLGRRAIVMCGDKTVPWRTLARFYNGNLSQMYGSTGKQGGAPDTFSFAKILFHYGLTGAQDIETLPNLFVATQQGNASDPRDKVFALLGVVEQDSHPEMVPDYNLSEWETNETLAAYFVKRFGIVFPSSIGWVYDWLRCSPDYPIKLKAIHTGDESFVDTKSGRNCLIIRGQPVTSAFVMQNLGDYLHLTMVNDGSPKSGFGETLTDITEIGGLLDWAGMRGYILVRVSKYHCVFVCLCNSFLYKLVGGVEARWKCPLHGVGSQCGPECPPKIMSEKNESFRII